MDTMFSIFSPSTFFNAAGTSTTTNCGATASVVQRATKRSASLGMSFDMAFSGFDSAAVALSTPNSKKKQINSPKT